MPIKSIIEPSMRKKVRLVSLLGWLLSLGIFVGLLVWMNKLASNPSLYSMLANVWLWDILFGIIAFLVLIVSFARKGKRITQEQKTITDKVSFLHKQRSPWFLVSAFLLLLLYAFQVTRTGSLVLGIKMGPTDCYINGVNMHATQKKCKEMLDFIKKITPFPSPTPPVLIDCAINGKTEQMVQEACDYFKNNPPTKNVYITQPSATQKIDCVGPDGVHMQITYQECVTFNNAWKGIKTETTPADSNAWGVASQVSEHIWTIKLGCDSVMATPKEIFDALNNYRNVHGRGTLGWNDKLAAFAQSRVNEQYAQGGLDSHAGFTKYLENQDNYKVLGFSYLGENSSGSPTSCAFSGVHLIEWQYAGDKPHDDNQLNPAWTSVGIAVSGHMTDLVFGHN